MPQYAPIQKVGGRRGHGRRGEAAVAAPRTPGTPRGYGVPGGRYRLGAEGLRRTGVPAGSTARSSAVPRGLTAVPSRWEG